jgi:hypothetical protein
MSSRRDFFMRKLEQPTDPNTLLNSMGIVLNRIERTAKPSCKLIPETAKSRLVIGEETKAPPPKPDKPVVSSLPDIPSLDELRARRKPKALDS